MPSGPGRTCEGQLQPKGRGQQSAVSSDGGCLHHGGAGWFGYDGGHAGSRRPCGHQGGESYIIPVAPPTRLAPWAMFPVPKKFSDRRLRKAFALIGLSALVAAQDPCRFIDRNGGNNSHIPVIGINVSRTKDVQETLVYELVEKVAAKVGIESPVPKEAVVCFGDYVGPGYSQPTAGMIEAVRMLAETEAILMDPVYTGQARCRPDRPSAQRFFQTGGKHPVCPHRWLPGTACLHGLFFGRLRFFKPAIRLFRAEIRAGDRCPCVG